MREMGNWREYQIERLANDREAAIDYLQLTLEEYLVDGNLPFFLKGLRTFVESQGGVSELSKRTNIEPEILSEVLSGGDAPLLDMLRTILNTLECRLSIEPQTRANSNLEIPTDSP
jgi:DNA-binding phage protein